MRYPLLTVSTAALLLCAATVGAGHGPCTDDLEPCLTAMAKKLKTKGWVGIELEHNDDGTLTITRVLPDSPAQAARLAAGDRIVALNGVAYAGKDRAALKKAYAAMVPGNTITYTVERGGRTLEVDVELVHVPQHVQAQWIAQHLVEGHARPADGGKPKP